jgi:hypothetical protein
MKTVTCPVITHDTGKLNTRLESCEARLVKNIKTKKGGGMEK